MIFLLSGVIGALGLVGLIWRRTLLGAFIGAQVLILGSSMAFVFAGILSGARVQGALFSLFIILSGVGQLAIGYALAVRFFYLNRTTKMTALRTLKR